MTLLWKRTESSSSSSCCRRTKINQKLNDIDPIILENKNHKKENNNIADTYIEKININNKEKDYHYFDKNGFESNNDIQLRKEKEQKIIV